MLRKRGAEWLQHPASNGVRNSSVSIVVWDWPGPELPPAVASVSVMPTVTAVTAVTSMSTVTSMATVASVPSMAVSAMTSVCGGRSYRGAGDAADDGCFRGGTGSVKGKRQGGACSDQK